MNTKIETKIIIRIDLTGKLKKPHKMSPLNRKKVETSLIHADKRCWGASYANSTIIAIEAPLSFTKAISP